MDAQLGALLAVAKERLEPLLGSGLKMADEFEETHLPLLLPE